MHGDRGKRRQPDVLVEARRRTLEARPPEHLHRPRQSEKTDNETSQSATMPDVSLTSHQTYGSG
jgi:hypothetical protein